MKLIRETEREVVFMNYGREPSQDTSLTVYLQGSEEESMHLKEALRSLPETCSLSALGYNTDLDATLLAFRPAHHNSYEVEISPREGQLVGATRGTDLENHFYVHLDEGRISCLADKGHKSFQIYSKPRSEQSQPKGTVVAEDSNSSYGSRRNQHLFDSGNGQGY